MADDYFHYVINAALALRKLTSIYIENPDGKAYNMRPQMHLFVCQPFGTGKSAVFKQIKAALNGDCLIEDEFTRAAFQGTVQKDKSYVPGIVNRVGGKVLCIDEWNNVNSDGRAALLSVLENNSFSRSLGFAVKKPEQFKDEWSEISVAGGCISGKINFTCIAGAMYFPKNLNLVDEKEREEALLSRFTPYFRSFSVEDVLEMKNGKLYHGFEDHALPELRRVIIPKATTAVIQKAYDDYVVKKASELTERQVGYFSRVWVDFVRFGVANRIMEGNAPGEQLVMDDPAPFLRDMEWHLDNQFRMYTAKDTRSTEDQFMDLVGQEPNMTVEWYAHQLGVTERTIYRYKERHKIAWMKGEPDSEEVIAEKRRAEERLLG